LDKAKPWSIPKQQVWEAYKRVKANRGAAGVDDQSIEGFERDLKNNLYKLWNRMSSGSYFPPPVKRVQIAKRGGGTRPLGIPTVADRIAQAVVKAYLEPELEKCFHPDSYGYRPGKSALQAVGVARERCWRYAWALDLDIRAFFDSIPHELLLRAVRKHTDSPWALLYIERWLKAPVQLEDGALEPREKGTPQGSVITPLTQKVTLVARSAFSAARGRWAPVIWPRSRGHGNAVSNNDGVIAHENFLDHQAHDTLAFGNIKRIGSAA
jgi:group II intron reverse transcriptase/maturase